MIPKRGAGRPTRYKWLNELKPNGEPREVGRYSNARQSAVMAAINRWKRKHDPAAVFISRKIEEGKKNTLKVWRTA